MRGTGLLLLSLCAAPASAFFVRPSVGETVGSAGYVSTTLGVDFGGALHLKPTFQTYRSDASTGSFRTYGLRLGYDRDSFGASLSAGFSPEVDGYRNRYGSVELTYSLDLERGEVDRAAELESEQRGKRAEDRKLGASRLDFTAGATGTEHADAFELVSRRLVRRSFLAVIHQLDFFGALGADLSDFRVDVEGTKTLYDKDLSALGPRAAKIARVSGLAGIVQGFPDHSVTARVESLAFDVFTPWASYTYTRFQFGAPDAAAYALGLDAGWRGVSLGGSYQRYAQRGAFDKDYFTLSAAYRFD